MFTDIDLMTKKVIKETLRTSQEVYSSIMLSRSLSAFTAGETASLIVDRPNMFFTFKKLGLYWDPEIVINVLRTSVVLKSIYWFTGLSDAAESQLVNTECDLLRKHGVRVVTKSPTKKEVRLTHDGKIIERYVANMDTDICCITLTECDKVDNIILASGDGDFVPLFKALRRRGQRTTLISTTFNSKEEGKTLSKNLRDHADVFIDLKCFYGVIKRVPHCC